MEVTMSEDLQGLLEKINRDGVEKAEAKAAEIIADAKAKEAQKRGVEQIAEDISELPTVPYELFRDSVDMKVWHLKADWSPKKKYKLMIPAGTFRNVAGEANDTLRSDYTTMDPEKRTLKRITLEDAAKADEIFTLLMGEKVEPRREYIETNAKFATNLDY